MASAAIDLGATSGRVVIGKYTGDSIQMTEIHRFQNNIIRVGGRSYWDLWGLWNEIITGLRKAASSGETIESIGVDTCRAPTVTATPSECRKNSLAPFHASNSTAGRESKS